GAPLHDDELPGRMARFADPDWHDHNQRGPDRYGDGAPDADNGDGAYRALATGDGTLYAGWNNYQPLVLCGVECGGGNGTELYQCDGLRDNGADNDSGDRVPEHAHRV